MNINVDSTYTFFILKPSTIYRKDINGFPLYLSILEELKDHGFEIVDKKFILMTKEDIIYIYNQEYLNLIPILGEENVKKMMEVNSKLYENKKCIVVIAKEDNGNAIQKALQLKGETFWPANCSKDTLRYTYRQPEFDNFEIPKGQIIDLPCDNIIHSPKEISELELVLTRRF